MFDASPTAAEADWKTTLSHGDVVAFRFPVVDGESGARPKTRPCLVFDTLEIRGEPYALIADGTSVRVRADTGLQVRVSGAAASEAGLHRDTWFLGARRLLVPLGHSGFSIAAELGSPVIGRLGGEAYERLNAVRARLDAQRDIAADRRERRRAAPRPTLAVFGDQGRRAGGAR
mgnify:CR=1 FL=1